MQKITHPGWWIEEAWQIYFCWKHYKHFPKVQRAKLLGIDRLLCFMTIFKSGNFKNLFAAVTSLPELSFRFWRFILLVQLERVISINYSSSKKTWKPQRLVRCDLIHNEGYIHQFQPEPTRKIHKQPQKLKVTLQWTISQMITKTVPTSTRIAISYGIKQGIPFWV